MSDYEKIDQQQINNAVTLLDMFTKNYCRYANDYARFEDLKFRCNECPFSTEFGLCLVKKFKEQYAPDYIDFGGMGDL